VSLCSRGRGAFLPDLGGRLQKDLDFGEYTDAISVINGGRH
jgi:hypothetical protein